MTDEEKKTYARRITEANPMELIVVLYDKSTRAVTSRPLLHAIVRTHRPAVRTWQLALLEVSVLQQFAASGKRDRRRAKGEKKRFIDVA